MGERSRENGKRDMLLKSAAISVRRRLNSTNTGQALTKFGPNQTGVGPSLAGPSWTKIANMRPQNGRVLATAPANCCKHAHTRPCRGILVYFPSFLLRAIRRSVIWRACFACFVATPAARCGSNLFSMSCTLFRAFTSRGLLRVCGDTRIGPGSTKFVPKC